MTAKTEKKQTVKVDICDLYRFLISNNRYGYTRMNHLMPSSAFDEARKYFSVMYKIDPHWALHTVMQLCDECIFELGTQFYDGLDDENYNRKEFIKFIEDCLKFLKEHGEERMPCHYDIYKRNIALDDEPRYSVIDPETNEVLKSGLSLNNYLGFIVYDVLGCSRDIPTTISYYRYEEKTGVTYKIADGEYKDKKFFIRNDKLAAKLEKEEENK